MCIEEHVAVYEILIVEEYDILLMTVFVWVSLCVLHLVVHVTVVEPDS